jgi:sugar lactone lactonase YvrE
MSADEMLDRFEELTGGLDHPEGVAWGPDGHVYAGGEAGQIYRAAPGEEPEIVATTGGFIYGVTLDGGGNVYACDFGRAEVARVSPTGAVESYSRGTDDRPLRVPNFCAFDADGNLYVTDSGAWDVDDGLIFRVAPGGETMVWTEEAPRFPNGCSLSLDGDALLVVESHRRAICRIPIADDGSAGPVEIVAELPGSQPDGIALGDDGTMFVGCYRPDRIYRISRGGEAEVLAEDPDGIVLNQPTNVAFAGAGLARLAVASLGGWSLMWADVGAVGAPLHYPSF